LIKQRSTSRLKLRTEFSSSRCSPCVVFSSLSCHSSFSPSR